MGTVFMYFKLWSYSVNCFFLFQPQSPFSWIHYHLKYLFATSNILITCVLPFSAVFCCIYCVAITFKYWRWWTKLPWRPHSILSYTPQYTVPRLSHGWAHQCNPMEPCWIALVLQFGGYKPYFPFQICF